MRRIADAGFIEAFCRHPAIWPHLVDDDTPEGWKPPIAPHIHWLLSDDGGALFMTYAVQPRLWDGHGQVLPEFRKNTTRYYREAFEYLKQNTPCARLIGLIPAGNYRAKRAAEAAGMKATTTLARCCKKGGRLIDMTLYEVEIS